MDARIARSRQRIVEQRLGVPGAALLQRHHTQQAEQIGIVGRLIQKGLIGCLRRPEAARSVQRPGLSEAVLHIQVHHSSRNRTPRPCEQHCELLTLDPDISSALAGRCIPAGTFPVAWRGGPAVSARRIRGTLPV